MDCGCKRVIKTEDFNDLIRFLSTREIKTIDRNQYQSWVEAQKRHFNNKANIEREQMIRKEGFIVQEIFKRSAGQDKSSSPRTIGALILKLAEYKTPEVKGFIIDDELNNRDVDKCIRFLLKEVEELCRKHGYDNYIVYTNMHNHTALSLFKTSQFQLDRVIDGPMQQEYIFKKCISPCYNGDPFNWLDKIFWYLKYFMGIEMDDLQYRKGHKIENFPLPIIKDSIIIPKSDFISTTNIQNISTIIVIFNGHHENIPEEINRLRSNNSKLILLFTRNDTYDLDQVINFTENDLNEVIKNTWLEKHA